MHEPSDTLAQQPFVVTTAAVLLLGVLLAVSALCSSQFDRFPQWASIAFCVAIFSVITLLVGYLATRRDIVDPELEQGLGAGAASLPLPPPCPKLLPMHTRSCRCSRAAGESCREFGHHSS